MKVKPGYILIYDDNLIWSKEPIHILTTLYYDYRKMKPYLISNSDFINWLKSFLQDMNLIASLKKYNQFIRKISEIADDKDTIPKNSEEEVLNELKELSDYILNELHYTKQPYFIYGKIDSSNSSGLKDIFTALTLDDEIADTQYKNIISAINNSDDNVQKFRIKRYVSDESILLNLNKG